MPPVSGLPTAGHHEQGLARFLLPARRERWMTGLAAGGRRREKVTERLYRLIGRGDLDPACVTPVERTGKAPVFAERLVRQLREMGAPETVYLLSDVPELDGRFLPLATVVGDVCGSGASAIVSCVPGELALYVDEIVDDSVFLRRGPAGRGHSPGRAARTRL